MIKDTESQIARSKRALYTNTRALTKKSEKEFAGVRTKKNPAGNKKKNKNNKYKLVSYDSVQLTGAHRSINLNNNNSTIRKYALLQQNSKLRNIFKETNVKNVILLDSNSNTATMCNENYAECA